MTSHTVTRSGLERMFPRALTEWLDALERLAPLLAAHYRCDRLRWVHFCGQIAAETDGLRLKRMQENMNFRSPARILEVYSYRLGVAFQKEPALKRKYKTREALAAALVGQPELLADLVYGDREGTPWRQGSRYLGRGPTQITHLNNYKAIGAEIARQPGGASFDLVATPELLADNPELGIRSAFADFELKNLWRYADRDDCDTLSDALNTGNVRDNVKPHGLVRRRAETARAKAIWPHALTFAVPEPARVAEADLTAEGARLAQSLANGIRSGLGAVPDAAALSERAPEVAAPVVPVTTPPLTPKTMLESKTGNTAIAMGTGGGFSIATEMSAATTRLAEAGTPFSLTNLLFALAQSPNFWLGLLFVGGSAFVWFDRRFKLRTFGI